MKRRERQVDGIKAEKNGKRFMEKKKSKGCFIQLKARNNLSFKFPNLKMFLGGENTLSLKIPLSQRSLVM